MKFQTLRAAISLDTVISGWQWERSHSAKRLVEFNNLGNLGQWKSVKKWILFFLSLGNFREGASQMKKCYQSKVINLKRKLLTAA